MAMISGGRHARFRSALAAFFGLACLFSSTVESRAQNPPSPLPSPTGYVNDFASVIDSTTKSRLETILSNLDKQQKIQFAVVTVDTTGDQDIFDFSLAVARGWGIGTKDTQNPSLLFLVAIKDRKYFTQVSRHLEGDLPDGLVGQIEREKLVPPFRQGQYSQGISDTVQTYVATLAAKRGFSIAGIDQKAASSSPRTSGRSRGLGFSPCSILFIIAIVIIFLVASRGKGGGCLNLFLLGSLLNWGGSEGSGGWGGGGSGDSGGGGGGFGGFGGGGDFGGGGAGGSW
jgi:uncharacterized protein